MANPAVTNVDGSNPGPNVSTVPDTAQSPVGNLWKVGTFAISLTPTAVNTITSPVQNYANTGIGLLTTDRVLVEYGPGLTPNNAALCNAYVSAADQLSIQWTNPTAGSVTPPAGTYY